MAELTPEEKEKIYAEEKARLEAQEKVKKEADTKKSQTGCIGLIVLLIFIAVVMWICGFFESDTNFWIEKPRNTLIYRSRARF